MSIDITLKRTLDDEFVSDVLITAFDGSVGACQYWCEPDYNTDDGSFLVTKNQEGDPTWVSVAIKHEDETGPEDAVCKHVVDAEVIRLGIQRILDDNDLIAPYIREYILSAVSELDAGHIDAEAADCIVQAGLFGTLVYG